MANKQKSKNQFYEAVVEFNVVSKLSLLLSRVNKLNINLNQHAIGGMVSCIQSLIDNDDGLTYEDRTSVCQSVIIPAIKVAIEDLNKVKVHPKDVKDLQDNIAWCYKALGSALHHMELYEEAVKELTRGVDILDLEFKDKAIHKKNYGLLLGSIGSAYIKQKLFEVALSSLERAKRAFEVTKATDWLDKNEKAQVIACNEVWLDICNSNIAGKWINILID